MTADSKKKLNVHRSESNIERDLMFLQGTTSWSSSIIKQTSVTFLLLTSASPQPGDGHSFTTVCFSNLPSLLIPPRPAEEERSGEGAGEEGALEGEEGGQAAEEGRAAGGGGGGGGECAAGGGPPGERLPAPRRAGAGEDEREAAEEDLLQEEQDGQCVCFSSLQSCLFSATQPFFRPSLETFFFNYLGPCDS